MTGEITLRGKVLPVGGIKEKILAAKRAGITDIILSEDNKKDILEIKEHYLTGLTFHYVKEMIEVVKLALLNEKVKNPINFQNTPSSNGSNINKEVATIAKKETKVTQKKTKALTPNTRTKSKKKK